MADDRPRPDLVLVVPCYNEASRLVPEAFVRFAAARPSARLLFVDDGSTDGTAGVLGRVCDAAPGTASVLHLAHNRGKADAVRQGMLQALAHGPAYVAFWDAICRRRSTPSTTFSRWLRAAPISTCSWGPA